MPPRQAVISTNRKRGQKTHHFIPPPHNTYAGFLPVLSAFFRAARHKPVFAQRNGFFCRVELEMPRSAIACGRPSG